MVKLFIFEVIEMSGIHKMRGASKNLTLTSYRNWNMTEPTDPGIMTRWEDYGLVPRTTDISVLGMGALSNSLFRPRTLYMMCAVTLRIGGHSSATSAHS
jgi:hypothetical protein